MSRHDRRSRTSNGIEKTADRQGWRFTSVTHTTCHIHNALSRVSPVLTHFSLTSRSSITHTHTFLDEMHRLVILTSMIIKRFPCIIVTYFCFLDYCAKSVSSLCLCFLLPSWFPCPFQEKKIPKIFKTRTLNFRVQTLSSADGSSECQTLRNVKWQMQQSWLSQSRNVYMYTPWDHEMPQTSIPMELMS